MPAQRLLPELLLVLPLDPPLLPDPPLPLLDPASVGPPEPAPQTPPRGTQTETSWPVADATGVHA
jgi:hypothetical protein